MTMKTNTWRAVLVGLALILLAGCGTLPPVKLDAPGEQRLTASDIVDVELSAADRLRIDPLIGPFGDDGRSKVETGPIWQRVFRGDGRSLAKIVITKAELRQSFAAMGFALRFTYAVEGRLVIGSTEYPVRSEGSRAAAMALSSAMRQAVELSVADLAHQANAILKMEREKSVNPPEPAR